MQFFSIKLNTWTFQNLFLPNNIHHWVFQQDRNSKIMQKMIVIQTWLDTKSAFLHGQVGPKTKIQKETFRKKIKHRIRHMTLDNLERLFNKEKRFPVYSNLAKCYRRKRFWKKQQKNHCSNFVKKWLTKARFSWYFHCMLLQ